MARHAIGRERGSQRAARPPRTIARKYGTGATVRWQQHAGRFAAHRLYRVSSSGSSVAGRRQRHDQAARPH
jgi:hypothetical protein